MKKKSAIVGSIVLGITFCLLQGTNAWGSGSWGQINQPVGRPDNWKAFVTDSPFALGDKKELNAGGQELWEQAYGSYPSLDGSTVLVPLAMELARQHLRLKEEDLQSFVNFSTTHNAYVRLVEKSPNLSGNIPSEMIMMEETRPVDLVLATEPSNAELKMAQEAGIVLQKTPVCHDAFVFLVNAKNPVNNLTLDEIRRVYIGEIQNWKVLGGSDADIIPFQREPGSGSQTAMENLVMQGVPLAGAAANYISSGMAELIAQIGNYDNGINSLGYSYLYYVENLYKSGEFKVLAVDGIVPNRENIQSGKYPLSTSYYAVHRDGDALGEAFTLWLLSEAGQQSVVQAGYIPLRP